MERKETRSEIIRTAIELFKEKGVNPVSISEICKKAHVTRNAFYYYFQTREVLFDAIGDYMSDTAKSQIVFIKEKNSAFKQIWEIYRPFLEFQLEFGADIMNHCCFSRTSKGTADTYMYVDERTAELLRASIEIAKQNGEIKTTAPTEDLVWSSYAVIRGFNIKWCFRYGESDLIGDAKQGLNTLFLPTEGNKLK